MKLFSKIAGGFVGLVVVVFIGLLVLNAYSTNHDRNQAFLKATVGTLPDGPYRGIVDGYQANWRGKKFNLADNTGMNLMGESERFPFQYYMAKGIVDTGFDVIRLDYSAPTNPFWLRRITDEIVEVEPGGYLGRVYLRLIPGKPFLVGFFRLEK